MEARIGQRKGLTYGYARVSTRDQHLDMQLDMLRRQQCVRIFCEKISGMKKRPELESCLSILQEGDVLVIYKLDRLARSLKEIINIWAELDSRKIRIRSIKDHIDTTDYMGKFTMHILAALAEFERNVILERTREGREAALKRGKVFGRPKGMDKKAREKARKAAVLYRSECPIKSICKTLNIKSKTTLYKYLKIENVSLRQVHKD